MSSVFAEYLGRFNITIIILFILCLCQTVGKNIHKKNSCNRLLMVKNLVRETNFHGQEDIV